MKFNAYDYQRAAPDDGGDPRCALSSIWACKIDHTVLIQDLAPNRLRLARVW